MPEPLGGLTTEQQVRIARALTAFEQEPRQEDTGRKQRTGYPTPFRIGKAAQTISPGGSGSVDIWKGSTSTGSAETITAIDWMGTGVANGQEVHVHRNWPTGEQFLTAPSTGTPTAFVPESAQWFSRRKSTGLETATVLFNRTSTNFTIAASSDTVTAHTDGVYSWSFNVRFGHTLSSTLGSVINIWEEWLESNVTFSTGGFNGYSDSRRIEFSGYWPSTGWNGASQDYHNIADIGSVTHGLTTIGVQSYVLGLHHSSNVEVKGRVTKISD